MARLRQLVACLKRLSSARRPLRLRRGTSEATRAHSPISFRTARIERPGHWSSKHTNMRDLESCRLTLRRTGSCTDARSYSEHGRGSSPYQAKQSLSKQEGLQQMCTSICFLLVSTRFRTKPTKLGCVRQHLRCHRPYLSVYNGTFSDLGQFRTESPIFRLVSTCFVRCSAVFNSISCGFDQCWACFDQVRARFDRFRTDVEQTWAFCGNFRARFDYAPADLRAGICWFRGASGLL